MNEYGIRTVVIANLAFWLALTIFGAAAIISWTPRKVYRHDNFIFRARPFEQKRHKALRISRWKDKLPIYRHNETIFDRRRLLQLRRRME